MEILNVQRKQNSNVKRSLARNFRKLKNKIVQCTLLIRSEPVRRSNE